MSLFIQSFPKELHKEIRFQAVRLDTNVSQLIIRIVQEWLEQHKEDQNGSTKRP